MPISSPDKATMFNESYPIVGEYVQDDSRIPYFNPADSGVTVLPGEPLVVQWNGDERVFMAQQKIEPGETGYLIRQFTADFPCDFSGNVVLGAAVGWDVTNSQVSLMADITNGFVLGNISYSPPVKPDKPSVDGSGRVICANATSDKCRVISIEDKTTTKGTVTVL